MSSADLLLLRSTMSSVLGPINLPFRGDQTLDHFIDEFAQSGSEVIGGEDLAGFIEVLNLIAADPVFKGETDDGFKAGFLLNALNNITTGVRLGGVRVTRSGNLFAEFVSHCDSLYMFKPPVVQLQFADDGMDIEVGLLHLSSKRGEHSMPPVGRDGLLGTLMDDAPRVGFLCPLRESLPSGLRYMQGDFQPFNAALCRLMPRASMGGLEINPLDFLLGPASIFKNVFNHRGVSPSSAVGGPQSLPLRIRDEDGVVTVALESTSLDVDLGKYLNSAASEMLEGVDFYKSNEFTNSALTRAARDSQELNFSDLNVSVTYDTNAGTIKYNCSNVPGALRPFVSAAVESRYEKNPEVVARNLHVGLENTYILTLKRDIDNFRKIKTACGILPSILSGSSNCIIDKINDGNFDEVHKIAQMKGFSEINEINMSMPTKRLSNKRKNKSNKRVNRNSVVSWCESVKMSANLKLEVLEKTLKDFEQQQQQQQEFMTQARVAIDQIRAFKDQYGADQSKKKQEIEEYCDSVSETLEQRKSVLHNLDAQVQFVNDMIVKSESHFKHNHEYRRVFADILVGLLCCALVGFLVIGLRSSISKARARSSGRLPKDVGSWTFRNASTKRRRAVEKILSSEISVQLAAAPSA